jgi:hypothetical protein
MFNKLTSGQIWQWALKCFRETGYLLWFVYFFGQVEHKWRVFASNWCQFCSASLPPQWRHFLITSGVANLSLYKTFGFSFAISLLLLTKPRRYVRVHFQVLSKLLCASYYLETAAASGKFHKKVLADVIIYVS